MLRSEKNTEARMMPFVVWQVADYLINVYMKEILLDGSVYGIRIVIYT